MNTEPMNLSTSFVSSRSTAMQTMHEALAREHLRQLHQEARQRALARELASARRWHFLERRAHNAYRRHAERAERAAQAAVAH
jgi:hypothetical protein